jgi:hypothetical protein
MISLACKRSSRARQRKPHRRCAHHTFARTCPLLALMALRWLLPLCALALTRAATLPETRVNPTPDFGAVNVTWAPRSDDNATTASSAQQSTLALTMAASTLGTLPLGVGRTQMTLLADAVDIPQARARGWLPAHAGRDARALSCARVTPPISGGA